MQTDIKNLKKKKSQTENKRPTLTVTKSFCIYHLFPHDILQNTHIAPIENKRSVNLSDRSGVGTGLVRQPISLVPN